MSKTTLVKVPTLKVVADDDAAKILKHLLKDADDGFRRVVKVGLYIEWLAANLPHGQLMPWVEAHIPDVGQMTIYRWRTMARNLCEWSGLKFTNLVNLQVPAEKLLDLPVDKLPEKIQKARVKMEEVLDSARTPKQLFLDIGFKQGDLDQAGYPKAKKGRRKGEGGATKEQRAKTAEAEEAARIEAIALKEEEIAEWLDENADIKSIGQTAGTKEYAKLLKAMEHAVGFMRTAVKGGAQ